MSSLGEPVASGADRVDVASSVAAQLPVIVHSCNRLGRVANPPGFSFSDWFRPGRRR
ncbi:hypothetical protein HLY00_4718 [Mycolicibacterium hippocampi]|uniref:Uncharacterized protein n=1 Tax=Mycolicibacterium hippocampi TaxID=659824 RepID=A0A850PDL7_9MYCO|nr:hypothetical protein [Mycolicibacterium hippocampi]